MMDPSITTRTSNRIATENRSLRIPRGLGMTLTLVIVLAFATTVAFAQPITDPFAMPFDAIGEIDGAREADADRWVALGETYAGVYEASAVASTLRYQAMAASFAAESSPAVQAAANPSMNVAQWYAAPAVASGSDDSSYAENPELISVSNWSATMAGASEGSLYAENPEILTAQNWAASGGSDLTCAIC